MTNRPNKLGTPLKTKLSCVLHWDRELHIMLTKFFETPQRCVALARTNVASCRHRLQAEMQQRRQKGRAAGSSLCSGGLRKLWGRCSTIRLQSSRSCWSGLQMMYALQNLTPKDMFNVMCVFFALNGNV